MHIPIRKINDGDKSTRIVHTSGSGYLPGKRGTSSMNATKVFINLIFNALTTDCNKVRSSFKYSLYTKIQYRCRSSTSSLDRPLMAGMTREISVEGNCSMQRDHCTKDSNGFTKLSTMSTGIAPALNASMNLDELGCLPTGMSMNVVLRRSVSSNFW